MNGKVWLTAYGGIIERPLKDNRDFLVHSGLFLAMKNSVYEKISVNKAGSLFTAIAGGEGIMLDFSKTDTDDILYLQSGNLNAFLDFIASSMPSNILPIVSDDIDIENNAELPVESENVESENVESENIESENVESENIESPVVSPTVESQTVESQTVESPMVESPTVESQTVVKQAETQTNVPNANPTITPLEIGGKRFRKTKSKYYKNGKKTRRR